MPKKRGLGRAAKRAVPLVFAGACVGLGACAVGPSVPFAPRPPAAPPGPHGPATLLDTSADQFRQAAGDRVRAVGARLAAAMRFPSPVPFRLLEGGEVNAYARNGSVYVTLGMLRFVENDDELALVVAHELGHLATDRRQGRLAHQDRERLADEEALLGLHRAGYDVAVACRLLDRMAAAPPGNGIRRTASHPTFSERYDRARTLARSLRDEAAGHGPPPLPAIPPPPTAELSAR